MPETTTPTRRAPSFTHALFGRMDERAIDTANRRIPFYAATGRLDGHGTIIEPRGVRKHIDEFMENPVVLAGHMHWYESGEPPVMGSVFDHGFERRGLRLDVEFAETRLAEEYWRLYSRGHMRAVSIGFRTVASRDEQDANNQKVVRITEWKLRELSLVALGSVPGALAKRCVVSVDELDQAIRHDHRTAANMLTALSLGAPDSSGPTPRDDHNELADRVEALESELRSLMERIEDQEHDIETILAARDRAARDNGTTNTNTNTAPPASRVAGLF